MAKTILVVEDEIDILKIINFRLKKSGYKIISALNGKEALDCVGENKPDLIVLDLVIPIIDGYEVSKRLKSDENFKNIPILLLTASATGNMLDKLKETKADDYLIKPFEPDELLKKIEELLQEAVLTKKKILIVEDEDSISKALEFRFKKSGFDVIIAGDGEEGLNKAREHKPDLIVLDLMLPKMTGERVCKEIRKDDAICKIPIIMLTAKNSAVERVIGKVIGANSYITKPFDLSELLSEINKLVTTEKVVTTGGF